MFPFTAERRTNWNNRDYRDYCDYRVRLKRRLRLRLTVGLSLLVFLVLILGLDAVGTRLRVQSEQLLETIKTAAVFSAPAGLQGSNDPAIKTMQQDIRLK